MRIKLALLADGANLSREGKLNVLGVFDTIFASALPTTHAHMQLVLRFEAAAAEVGTTHDVEVSLGAPGGQAILQLAGKLSVPRPAVGEGTVAVDHILTFVNVRFDTAGIHVFRIGLDGVEGAVVPLRVEQVH